MNTEKQTIVIIGGNRGLGLELVRQYLAADWQVISSCRQPEKATALQQLKEQYPKFLQVHALEVTDKNSRKRFAEQLNGASIDILFHNAGIYGPTGGNQNLSDLNETDWLHTFHANSIAPIKVIEALLPNLKLGKKKTIALMTSKMGSIDDNSSGGSYIYRSSKAALNMAGKSLAVDLAPLGFTVMLLHPGWVKTDMGGPNAPITVEQSVKGLRQVIDQATPKSNGSFMTYDGQNIPW